jgi:hypothetical protein
MEEDHGPQVPASIITKVREMFSRKAKQMEEHSCPWTPWALCNLLEIDDRKLDLPAEIILYKALRGKGRTGIGQWDPVVKVALIQ